MRIRSIFLIAALAAGLAPEAPAAEPYPARPIRFIVPFAAGGGTDMVGRAIAQKLTEAWGQQVIVDNRPGGGSVLGTALVARANPDGYTILQTSPSFAVAPSLRKLPYSQRDFEPITQTATQAYLLAGNPGLAARSVQELIALDRAQPGSLNFASSGTGGVSHLAGELFKLLTKTDIVHVAYKGTGPLLVDLIAGHVQLSFATSLPTLPHVKAGRVRVLAVSGARRSAVLPEIPTIAEAGVKGYEATSWNGILVPAGTPRPVRDKLYREIAAILKTPALTKWLARDGGEAVGSTPSEFAAFIRTETEKWGKVVKAARLTAE